jgi:hypothetical protein
MKTRSSPRELTGCHKVRQAFGQDCMDLAYRSNETVVRRGNDANDAIDGRAVAGLSIRIHSIRIQESRILSGALRMAQDKAGPGQLHQRPGPTGRYPADHLQPISWFDLRG